MRTFLVAVDRDRQLKPVILLVSNLRLMHEIRVRHWKGRDNLRAETRTRHITSDVHFGNRFCLRVNLHANDIVLRAFVEMEMPWHEATVVRIDEIARRMFP